MSDSDFTVGDLRLHLQGLSDDTKLSFGGGLTFYRIRTYDNDEAHLEFGEPQAFLDDGFKQRNPNVKVAFIRTDNVHWDDEGLLGGPIDVSVR